MTSNLHSAPSDRSMLLRVKTQWSIVQPHHLKNILYRVRPLCHYELCVLITVLAAHNSDCDHQPLDPATLQSRFRPAQQLRYGFRFHLAHRFSYRRISCTRGCSGAGANPRRGLHPEQVAAASQQGRGRENKQPLPLTLTPADGLELPLSLMGEFWINVLFCRRQ